VLQDLGLAIRPKNLKTFLVLREQPAIEALLGCEDAFEVGLANLFPNVVSK